MIKFNALMNLCSGLNIYVLIWMIIAQFHIYHLPINLITNKNISFPFVVSRTLRLWGNIWHSAYYSCECIFLQKQNNFNMPMNFNSIFPRTRLKLSAVSCQQCPVRDDVIKWKHFPHHWPFCAGNSPVTGEFPSQSQWRRALMFPWSVPEQTVE